MKIFSLKTILLFAILSFFSCKKNSDSNNTDYYVKLRINGNWVTWKTVVGEIGPDLADATKTDFGVTANDNSNTDVFDISVQVDGHNFTTGTYDSDNGNYWVDISYAKAVGTGNSKYYMINDKAGLAPSRYLVTVTSITDKELRGTFTGNYLYDDFDDETLNVTDGEFFVKRAR
jgi:hypothetical protein